MLFDDLRQFIEEARTAGELKVVEGADWDLELGTITHLAGDKGNSPVLLFDKIKGYPQGYRVVTNMFATARRTALTLGLPLEARGLDLVRALRDRIKNIRLIPPIEVDDGPVKENILTENNVDLYRFPTPKWHEHDGGRYIGTGSVGVMRDPDEGWINLGTYRTQIHDRNTVTMSMVPGHRGESMRKKWWARGLPCPVAICCGQEPTLWGASHWDGLQRGVSEYEFAGGLRGEPVKVTKGVYTDLPIPATAEIVLEGEILPPEIETRQEGPFGEWCGYYAGGVRTMPAIRIKAILHRNAPILQGNPPHRYPSIWSVGKHIQKAAYLWNELDRQVPNIHGVWVLEEGALHSIIVISIRQSHPGHAKQAGLLAAVSSATNFQNRFVIVVDEDIDPSNISQVLWALGTRVDLDLSIDIVKNCLSGESNPMLSPEAKRLKKLEMSRAIITACKPYTWKDEFPLSVEPSPELAARIREKWKAILS
jgi:UbiD family decarboxylase